MGPSLDCCECFVAMKRPKPFLRQRGSPNPNKHQTNTGKATKGKVQDIGEVNKVMPLPLPSSDRVRG